jgi:hypothetical protein
MILLQHSSYIKKLLLLLAALLVSFRHMMCCLVQAQRSASSISIMPLKQIAQTREQQEEAIEEKESLTAKYDAQREMGRAMKISCAPSGKRAQT